MSYETYGWKSASQRAGATPTDPVLFYAERPFWASLGGQGLPLLLCLPFVLLAPELGPFLLLTSLGMAVLQHVAFRFQLTARHVIIRGGAFAPTMTVPLSDVRAVEALNWQGQPVYWGRAATVGHLRMTLADTATILVPAVRDPAEAADAIRQLQGRADDRAPVAA